MKKFVMSYSCGKDSTLSLYRMIKRGHTPLALLVTVDKKVCRSWFHGIQEHLLNEVSKSLEAIFPLWLEDREELTYEFIDSGFKTVIKNVRLNDMGPEFLGEVLTKEVVERIKETGSDPCGENGEYHTFVFDGPLFRNKIQFETGENILTETHGYLDIR